VNLNGSPSAIKDFNDLPVKTVNGTVIYMRDVAFVHDGAPPQTNVVHVDGQNAVLLSIVKTGTTSTLAIISQIKQLLPSIRATLPSSLNISAVGDQSSFVTNAVSGVVREGLIAAALTALMILLFIGSWRSTVIIITSIPLAILASVAALSALGETINIMTLGGLALAVGILVDDATVTIENINWHLESGKDVTSAIMDGARQIVVPATVSLMCICIAFVPMVGLGGVAGYLFRPLAEAVLFALVASYLLSRTLVPTLANYLLKPRAALSAPSRGILSRIQQGFERYFENIRAHYRGLLQLCLQKSRYFVIAFMAATLISFGLAPFLGSDFFPATDGGQIKIHVRGQTGLRIEETTRLSDRIGEAIHRIIPPDQLEGIVDNIGLPVSGINMAYNNSGAIGDNDADILVSLTPSHAPTADYVRTMREQLPRMFPGAAFSFLPADMVSQILNFGSPAPIDLQVVGDLQTNRAYADSLLAKVRTIPGIADARIQQAFALPTLNVDMDRSLAGLVGLTEDNAVTAMRTTLSGSAQTSPTYWLDPKTGVSYPVSVQTPSYAIDTMPGLINLPLTGSSGTSTSAQVLGGLARVQRGFSNAVVSHYNVRPVIDIYATPQGRDLGGVVSDIHKAMQSVAQAAPAGTTTVLRGQAATMASAYQQLFVGLAFAIVLIYLLIVVNFQSWLDPFVIVAALPTALAGIVWMLFATGTTLSVPALTGAIMCMGVATANSILVIAFARERMTLGDDAAAAAMAAGSTRFRPVLMTALAMIIGMLPMAIEPSQNAPLGRAVIGGLAFATFATLLLVPTLFSLVHRRNSLLQGENHGA
jgi:multidrug efflux pump subunit AcrB